MYFPDGGSIQLDLTDVRGTFSLKWLNVEASRWEGGPDVNAGAMLRLKTPASGHWVALLKRK